MRRINYLPPRGHERLFNAATATFADRQIRSLTLAIAGAILIVFATWAIESVRLQAAERDANHYSSERVRTAAALQGAEKLEAHVTTLRAISASVVAIRRSAMLRESELASIGNHLPRGVWLADIRFDAGAWHIDGRSEKLSTIGSAMMSLRSSSNAQTTRLVSLHGSGKKGSSLIDYQFDLEPKE